MGAQDRAPIASKDWQMLLVASIMHQPSSVATLNSDSHVSPEYGALQKHTPLPQMPELWKSRQPNSPDLHIGPETS